MSRVIVLGGCGAVGSVVVKTLATQDAFSEVVIGDMNVTRANLLVEDYSSDKLSVRQFDAGDSDSIISAIAGCDLVVNCVGPFYKTVELILATVIDEGINYLDICDDVDVTLNILDWSQKAEEKGVCALIGMGSSPGATNILAAFAANTLLEETDSIDIFHAHGGEPFEGEGVIGHRFHCMSIDIPMFLDGELKYVKYFEEDGIALRESFDFPILGEGVQLYPYPHPEQVTLPRYIKTKQVTNKGTVLPDAYYELTRDMCALGLNSREPISVNGQSVVPYDFSVAHILKARDRMLKESNFGQQRGCVSIVVKGKKSGKYREYRFHLASQSQALGEGTGLPAAMGAILMQQGKIKGAGVFPPEAIVNPLDFIALLPKVVEFDAQKEGGQKFGGIIVEQVDENGKVSTIDI